MMKTTHSFPLFCFLFSFGGTRLRFVVFTTVFFTFADALIMTLIRITPTTTLLYACKFMDRIQTNFGARKKWRTLIQI